MMNKKTISIRYWLHGKDYHLALKALEYASSFHAGLRKDGVTPEFDHQLSIALYIKTFYSHLDFPEETLAVVFLHDVAEDFDVGFEELESLFGITVSEATKLLTKKHRGHKLSLPQYYDAMSRNPIASIVKGGDRIHNHQTMCGVFDKEKQLNYITETNELILPMLKSARRRFTKQEPAYENIKLMLNNQISLIQEIHAGNKD